MKVLLAKTAGFCFGVKRAVDTVYQQVEENKDCKIYTFGPIIHNDEVIKDMQAKGVTVLEGEEDLPKAKNGIVIIRSHGVPKRICDRMDELGIQYVDATCPFVKKIHKIAMEKAEEGAFLVVIGNPVHPEVEGIMGWAGEDAAVISTAEEAEHLTVPEDRKICVVAQTTFNYNKFKELVETEGALTFADEHVIGVAKGVDAEVLEGLKAHFTGECTEVGMYLAMSRQADREGYPEVAEAFKRYAWEEAEHAAKFCELLGECVWDTETNLKKRMEAEAGACEDKKRIATLAKKLNLDAIHDTVHEMCKDEARHGKGFEGLYNRYFKK